MGTSQATPTADANRRSMPLCRYGYRAMRADTAVARAGCTGSPPLRDHGRGLDLHRLVGRFRTAGRSPGT